jgi:hypothetical protein
MISKVNLRRIKKENSPNNSIITERTEKTVNNQLEEPTLSAIWKISQYPEFSQGTSQIEVKLESFKI